MLQALTRSVVVMVLFVVYLSIAAIVLLLYVIMCSFF